MFGDVILIGYYNYTVYLTYIGMLSSTVGIMLAISGNIRTAVFCLLFSGLCDMFDGIVARTKKDRTEEEKGFGIQLDSLSDVICFGVFPAVLGFCAGATKVWQMVIMALFALAGLIRLAYYNVTEEARQKETTEKRKHYLGVPITSSALTVPIVFCFRKLLGASFPVVYTLILLLNGLCFVLPIQVKKPGRMGLAAMLVIGLIMGIFILVNK